ncbi:DNA-binding protein Alba [Allomyces macrogynus ATCC 38327]|uniref:DNA-binding protein Alba n=1 Tax=Allomyces macrogynus (strain ATCC 38327) TaxID=578462 RepID=A0A0L0T5J9_ALLM3|nr:DNA-binding protein Alba [Allomyces macrogynus ATCC 38327]|eukprot:KNE70017.1 DNA-binding protein Alba [Allomyces macrogynus ATCC 38327]
MDHYRPAAAATTASSTSTTVIPSTPPEHASAKVISVTANGRIRGYIAAALSALESPHLAVHVYARGAAINKAVSVVEIIRRKLPAAGVTQMNALGSVAETDAWEPKDADHGKPQPLDRIVVTKHTPYLTATLAVDPEIIAAVQAAESAAAAAVVAEALVPPRLTKTGGGGKKRAPASGSKTAQGNGTHIPTS